MKEINKFVLDCSNEEAIKRLEEMIKELEKQKNTYESICEKLGFDPLTYEPECPGYEDDSKISPFHKLTLEESLFLNEYLMKHKKDN